MRALVIVAIVLARWISLDNAFATGQVTLGWDTSSDPTVTGYNVYYGGSSQTYTSIVSAGQNNSAVVTNLAAGATYYFAATAVNFAGLESVYSSEVVYQIGGTPCVVNLTNLSQVYDGKPKPVTVSTVPAGLPWVVTYNGLSNPPAVAGSYQVVATVTATNYSGSVTNTLTIAKAVGTIQFAGLNQIYDGTAKTASATSIPAGLTVNLSYPGLTTLPVTTGTYPITATIAEANYVGSASNSLTIARAAAKVFLSNLNQTFDGTPKAVSATTTPSGLAILLTYNGQSQAPSRIGTYTVVGSVNSQNYAGTATNTLTITKAKAHAGASAPALAGSTAPSPAITFVVESPGPSLVLSWLPTTNIVNILHSSDLITWVPLTHTNGSIGSLLISQDLGAHFFTANTSGAGMTNRIALSIRPR